MKWVELAKIKLPERAVLLQVLPCQGAALVLYQIPGENHRPRWFLARWEYQAAQPTPKKPAAFAWEHERKGCPQFLSVEGDLLIGLDAASSHAKLYLPTLCALKAETGVEVWSHQTNSLSVSIDRGRLYTLEKALRGPYRIFTRNLDTGKPLRREPAYDAYDEITARDDLIFGSASQRPSVTTLDGEPLFEAESPAPLRAVAADGSLYMSQVDAQSRYALCRWEPRTRELWSLSLSQPLLQLLPLPAAGQVLYAEQAKRQHLALVYYDWSTDQERWRREVKLSNLYNVRLSPCSEGFLLSSHQQNLLFDAFTGAERIVPLSHSGPMFASKDALLLVKGQQLLAYSWK